MASQLLADVLARIGRYNVKAVGSPSEVLGIIESANPHIAVISADAQAGPTKGIETVGELHKHHPHVLVIVLVDAASRDIVIQAFRAGARGVFCRTEAVSVFARCVKSVHLGQIWAGPTEMEFLLEAIIATTPPRVVDAFGVELLSSR